MRAVIFDVGNVLIHWHPRQLFRRLLADEASVDAFLTAVDFDSWNLELDRGQSWDAGVAALAAAHPRHAGVITAFRNRWQETVADAIDGSVEILGALKQAGVPLYAITNFSAEKWAETILRFPFLANSFRDIVVSAHEGVVKPDPAIFRILLERNRLAPARCIFIDDNERNVTAAAALGIDAIPFTTPAALRAALIERKLLP